MLTPARRHFENVMAQNRGNGVTTLAEQTAYEQILHRLRIDQNRLKGIQSKKTKAEEKQKLLPDYQGWVDGALAADSGQSDDVLTRVMLWHIDAGNIPEALRIGEYVVRHKLAMPDRFNRTAPVTLIDEICDPVLASFKAAANVKTVSADLLKALDGMTANEDVPEPVRAKLWKVIGYTLRTDTETQAEALEYLRKAIAEFSDIGVKRDIELLERLMNKAALTDLSENGAGTRTEEQLEIPVSAVTAMAVVDESESVEPANVVIVAPAKVAIAAKPVAKRGRPAGAKKTTGTRIKKPVAAKKAAAE